MICRHLSHSLSPLAGDDTSEDAELDVTVASDRSSIEIHEASYSVTSLDPITLDLFTFEGLPIDLHAEFRVEDI